MDGISFSPIVTVELGAYGRTGSMTYLPLKQHLYYTLSHTHIQLRARASLKHTIQTTYSVHFIWNPVWSHLYSLNILFHRIFVFPLFVIFFGTYHYTFLITICLHQRWQKRWRQNTRHIKIFSTCKHRKKLTHTQNVHGEEPLTSWLYIYIEQHRAI